MLTQEEIKTKREADEKQGALDASAQRRFLIARALNKWTVKNGGQAPKEWILNRSDFF